MLVTFKNQWGLVKFCRFYLNLKLNSKILFVLLSVKLKNIHSQWAISFLWEFPYAHSVMKAPAPTPQREEVYPAPTHSASLFHFYFFLHFSCSPAAKTLPSERFFFFSPQPAVAFSPSPCCLVFWRRNVLFGGLCPIPGPGPVAACPLLYCGQPAAAVSNGRNDLHWAESSVKLHLVLWWTRRWRTPGK